MYQHECERPQPPSAARVRTHGNWGQLGRGHHTCTQHPCAITQTCTQHPCAIIHTCTQHPCASTHAHSTHVPSLTHAYSIHVPSHMHTAPMSHHSRMHTARIKPTWRAVRSPSLGKDSTPCTMFLSYTGCLCFSIFATRHWDHGALSSVGSGATEA